MSPPFPERRLAPFLLLALLVTAGTPATAISTAPSPPVAFADAVVSEQRGDVAEIPVRFLDAEEATVRIGTGANRVAAVVVRDADGDDRATVRLNTYDGTVDASEGDAITRRNRSNAATPLPTGSYRLDLRAGNATDGERWDVATLSVGQRSTDGLRTWVAPASADLSTPSAVETAKATGTLTRTHDATAADPALVQYAADAGVPNDTLVLELRASGLEGRLATRNGSNATTRFFDLLESDAVTLRVRQTNPGTSFEPKEFHLAEYDSTHVVADADNDTYYLVVDTTRANVTGGPDGEIDDGDVYLANLTTSPTRSLAPHGRQSVTTRFRFQSPAAVVPSRGFYDTDLRKVLVAPSPNRTIRGRTTLPPGREVTVTLRARDDDSLSLSKTVEVRNRTADEWCRFAAVFDFSGVAPGTNFTVDVRAHNRSIIDSWPPTYVVVEASATDSTTATTRASGAESPVTTATSPTRKPTTDREAEPESTQPTSSASPTAPDGEVPGFGVTAVAVALLVATTFARKEKG